MEATYCVGTDIDVCRMFDQYLYKRNDLDLSLSIPQGYGMNNNYNMNHDQTFHTPSFGDDEFDIPEIKPFQQHQQLEMDGKGYQHEVPPHPMYTHDQQNMYQQQQNNLMQMNGPEGMPMHDGYPQQMYMSNEHHMMNVSQSYHHQNQTPPNTYTMAHAQAQHNQQMLLQMQHQHQQQQHHHQMMMNHGGQPPPQQAPHIGAMAPNYGHSPQHQQLGGRGNSPPANKDQGVGGPREGATSEDSDDSTPHNTVPMPSLKRPSPEPVESNVKVVQQKKPKVQKKKKKRDPNEPQKPVSAYALFFRDTQAAIKGQHPNASFGEVSKIVASMWDALDTDHKNVYKKKTELAKKEYLKDLAAYRANLVSKGAGEGEGMYGGYPNYNNQYGGYSPQTGPQMSPQLSATPPNQSPSPQQTQGPLKKSPLMSPPPQIGGGQQPGPMLGMMQGQMAMPPHMQGHLQQQTYMQQVNHGVASHMQHLSPSRSDHMSPPPPPSPGASAPPPQSPHQQIQLAGASDKNDGQQQEAGGGNGGQETNDNKERSDTSSTSNEPAPTQNGDGAAAVTAPTTCIRRGCTNAPIVNAEWQDEYCSNECVVSHCRDVFSTWVATNKNSQSLSTVK